MVKTTSKQLINQYIKPYLMWFKVGLLITLFMAGWVTSCKHYKNADAQVDAEAAAEVATLRKANYDYAQADKARAAVAASEQAAQKKRDEDAVKAVAAAEKRAQTLAGKLSAIEAKQAKAKADPKCRDIMELEVCPALR